MTNFGSTLHVHEPFNHLNFIAKVAQSEARERKCKHKDDAYPFVWKAQSFACGLPLVLALCTETALPLPLEK